MSPEARKLLEWLVEGPGRRLTYQRGQIRKVELGGALGEATEAAPELLVPAAPGLPSLLEGDGPGFWKPSAAGILEGAEAPKGRQPDAWGVPPSLPPDRRRCCQKLDHEGGRRCWRWTNQGSHFCAGHQPGAQVTPEVKVGPRAARYKERRRKGPPIPIIEEKPVVIPTEAPPAELAKLPTLPVLPKKRKRKRKRAKCQAHGVKSCIQCEELAALDDMAGRRLRAKLEEIRKQRRPYS